MYRPPPLPGSLSRDIALTRCLPAGSPLNVPQPLPPSTEYYREYGANYMDNVVMHKSIQQTILLSVTRRLLLVSLSTSFVRTASLVSTHTSTLLPVMTNERTASSEDGATGTQCENLL